MTFTVFICGVPKPDCYRCGMRAVKRCDGPGATPDTTCDRPLCDDHARGSMCAQHAPEQVTTTMPKPPRRP